MVAVIAVLRIRLIRVFFVATVHSVEVSLTQHSKTVQVIRLFGRRGILQTRFEEPHMHREFMRFWALSLKTLNPTEVR